MTIVAVRSIGDTTGDVVGKADVTESSIWAVCGVLRSLLVKFQHCSNILCRRSFLASVCVAKWWDVDLGMGVWK